MRDKNTKYEGKLMGETRKISREITEMLKDIPGSNFPEVDPKIDEEQVGERGLALIAYALDRAKEVTSTPLFQLGDGSARQFYSLLEEQDKDPAFEISGQKLEDYGQNIHEMACRDEDTYSRREVELVRDTLDLFAEYTPEIWKIRRWEQARQLNQKLPQIE